MNTPTVPPAHASTHLVGFLQLAHARREVVGPPLHGRVGLLLRRELLHQHLAGPTRAGFTMRRVHFAAPLPLTSLGAWNGMGRDEKG